MDPALFIQYFKRQRLLLGYAIVSGCAIFIYDYILTLHLEVKLIWFSRWTYTKVLYLLVRYTTFAYMVSLLYVLFVPNHSSETCKTTFTVSVSLQVTLMSLADIILAIRTWVVWNLSRTAGITLAILVIIDVAARLPLVVLFLQSLEFSPLPHHGYMGCFLVKGIRIVWTNFALMFMLQAGVLTVVAASAFRSYLRGLNSELWNVIHKEGIMFYVYVLCFTGFNLVLSATLPLDLSFMFAPAEVFVYSALTTRIVLSIREIGNREPAPIDLHTSHVEMPLITHTHQFVSEQSNQEEVVRNLDDRPGV